MPLEKSSFPALARDFCVDSSQISCPSFHAFQASKDDSIVIDIQNNLESSTSNLNLYYLPLEAFPYLKYPIERIKVEIRYRFQTENCFDCSYRLNWRIKNEPHLYQSPEFLFLPTTNFRTDVVFFTEDALGNALKLNAIDFIGGMIHIKEPIANHLYISKLNITYYHTKPCSARLNGHRTGDIKALNGRPLSYLKIRNHK